MEILVLSQHQKLSMDKLLNHIAAHYQLIKIKDNNQNSLFHILSHICFTVYDIIQWLAFKCQQKTDTHGRWKK